MANVPAFRAYCLFVNEGVISMSETKTSSKKSSSESSASKTSDSKPSKNKSSAPKSSETKSPDSKSPDSKSSETKSSDSKSSETKSADKGGTGDKSASQSVGGASQVHYGYFSSVRSKEYRSGWDDIWKKKSTKR